MADHDWFERQFWASLDHLRSIPPELLPPVAQELLKHHETRFQKELDSLLMEE